MATRNAHNEKLNEARKEVIPRLDNSVFYSGRQS